MLGDTSQSTSTIQGVFNMPAGCVIEPLTYFLPVCVCVCVSHVKLVRKNLVLTTGPGRTSAERAGLIRERAELQRELNSLKLAVGQLDMDFSRVQTDISTIGKGQSVF